MNWDFDPGTGLYSLAGPSPTGIPSDPVLTALGVRQAEELAVAVGKIEPPVELIICSPYYRCLQTIAPTARLLRSRDPKSKILVENGVG
jgi:transcription factor C subunit 7